MKILLGKVNIIDKNKIEKLFERYNGLEELNMIVSHEEIDLKKQIETDIYVTNLKIDKLFKEMASRYKWVIDTNIHWEIDYETNEVYFYSNDS